MLVNFNYIFLIKYVYTKNTNTCDVRAARVLCDKAKYSKTHSKC